MEGPYELAKSGRFAELLQLGGTHAESWQNAAKHSSSTSTTFLHQVACMTNDANLEDAKRLVTQLIAHGARLDVRNVGADNKTPLEMCTHAGLKPLLTPASKSHASATGAGASPSQGDMAFPYELAKSGRFAELLQLGGTHAESWQNAAKHSSSTSTTFLHQVACMTNDANLEDAKRLVTQLIAHGARLDVRNVGADNKTPLEMCTHAGLKPLLSPKKPPPKMPPPSMPPPKKPKLVRTHH